MKIALCFLISYDHQLNKEKLWQEWILPNKDIINIYFHYKDYNKIKSQWIKDHTIPQHHTVKTSYYHVVPAYISLLSYAHQTDLENQWFCMLTDACVPIISPAKFRKLFLEHSNKSIIRWKKPWWNVQLKKRANLHHLPEDFQLGHEPWFIIKKEDLKLCLHFIENQRKMFNFICKGILANESIFAIILQSYKKLNDDNIINELTHLADWSRMESSTSPHLFKEGSSEDLEFIHENIENNPFAMFLRKVSPKFPDEIILNYINIPDDKNVLSVQSIQNNILIEMNNDIIKQMKIITWGIHPDFIKYVCICIFVMVLYHTAF